MITNFNGFRINENSFQPSEHASYYMEKHEHIPDVLFGNVEALVKHVEDNILQAHVKFFEKYDIPKVASHHFKLKNSTKTNTEYGFNLQTEPLDLALVGLDRAFSSITVVYFGDMKLMTYSDETGLYYKPVLWGNLNVRTETVSGGGNGADYMYDMSGDRAINYTYYNVEEGRVMNSAESKEYNPWRTVIGKRPELLDLVPDMYMRTITPSLADADKSGIID